MSLIRGKDTVPELLLRRALHREGFRYRLYVKTLPGKPDIVLPKYRTVIFINGCFWHGHDCHYAKKESSMTPYWREKIFNNRKRDAKNIKQLRQSGWRVIVVWECKLVTVKTRSKTMLSVIGMLHKTQILKG